MNFALHSHLLRTSPQSPIQIVAATARGAQEVYELTCTDGILHLGLSSNPNHLLDELDPDRLLAKTEQIDACQVFLTQPLTQLAIQPNYWHELSCNSSKQLRSIRVSSTAALVEFRFEDGKLTSSRGESIAPGVSERGLFSHEGLEMVPQVVASFASIFSEIQGESVVHALWNRDTDRLIILDIKQLGGIWLTPLPRYRRNEIIDEVFRGVECYFVKSLSLEALDEDYVPFDDSLAEVAYESNNKILAINLMDMGAKDKPAHSYYWVDPESTVAYRVLSSRDDGHGTFYGLGLVDEDSGDEVLALTLHSRYKAEEDDLVDVVGYMSFNLSPVETMVLKHPQLKEGLSLSCQADSVKAHLQV